MLRAISNDLIVIKAVYLNMSSRHFVFSLLTLQRGGRSFGQKAEAEILSSFGKRGP